MKNTFLICLFTCCFLGCKNPKSTSINIDIKIDSLEIFAKNKISTPLFERDFAISPNRKEIIYTLGESKQEKRFLVHLKNKDGVWDAPKVMHISGEYQDIEPFFSLDGKKLFFASNRPIYNDDKRKDYNIWFSEKVENTWVKPTPLDTLINTNNDEFYPSVSKNGNLYFTATRKDGVGKEDIFVSKFMYGKYQHPTVLSEKINTKTYEFNAYINADESLLIFSSYGRKDGFGGGDLYFSKKDRNGNWERSKNMGKKFNSKFLDYCPFLDSKTNNLYFSSDRSKNQHLNSVETIRNYANSIENGLGNIYRVPFKIK